MTALQMAMQAAEDLAAHSAMRQEFEAWMREEHSNLFDLAHRLNMSAARAVQAIKNARRA